MNWYKVIIAITLLLKTVSGTINSTPAHVNGVITTCAGSQISITCNHSNLHSGVTKWKFSLPTSCEALVSHGSSPSYSDCVQFTFQNVTPLEAQDGILSSTAIATANISMTGTLIRCLDSSGLNPVTIGNITLCVIGDKLSLTVTDTADGVMIEWYPTKTSEHCQRNINYTVIIDTTDNLSNNSLVLAMFGETRTTVPGLIPNQLYTVQVIALVSSCASLTAISNFTKSGDLTSTMNPNNTNDGGPKQRAWIVPMTVCVTVIIVLAVIVIVVFVTVVIIKQSHKRTSDSTVKVAIQKKSETSELIYAKVDTNTKHQAHKNVKISEDEPRVQYSEIQQAKCLSYASVVFSTPEEEQHTTRNSSPREPVQTTFKIQSKGEQHIAYSQVNIQRQTFTGETNEVHQNQATPSDHD